MLATFQSIAKYLTFFLQLYWLCILHLHLCPVSFSPPKQVVSIVIFPSSFHACILVLHASHCSLDSCFSSFSVAGFDLLRPSSSPVGHYLCCWTLPRARHYCPHSQPWIWLITLFLCLLDCVHAWLPGSPPGKLILYVAG